MGVIAGGMGHSISTEGIARFGQMLLNKVRFKFFKARKVLENKIYNRLILNKSQVDNSRYDSGEIKNSIKQLLNFFSEKRGKEEV